MPKMVILEARFILPYFDFDGKPTYCRSEFLGRKLKLETWLLVGIFRPFLVQISEIMTFGTEMILNIWLKSETPRYSESWKSGPNCPGAALVQHHLTLRNVRRFADLLTSCFTILMKKAVPPSKNSRVNWLFFLKTWFNLKPASKNQPNNTKTGRKVVVLWSLWNGTRWKLQKTGRSSIP